MMDGGVRADAMVRLDADRRAVATGGVGAR
jgi:hypothetical protein